MRSGFIFFRVFNDLVSKEKNVSEYAVNSERCHNLAVVGDMGMKCPLMPSWLMRVVFFEV